MGEGGAVRAEDDGLAPDREGLVGALAPQVEVEEEVAAEPTTGRQAPRPRGLLSGRRSTLRRHVSFVLAGLNRMLDRLPPGRWAHRYLQRQLEFTSVEVRLRRGAVGLDGLRVAFLSDIHAGSYMNEADLCSIFSRVAAQEPDLVCLGGDLINTRDRELLLFRRALGILAPPLGVYAVPGNHDLFWGRDIGLWSAFLEEHGVKVLRNSGLRIEHGGAEFWLCGVDDLTEGEPDLAAALAGSAAGEPKVVLSHHPDFFFEAAAVGVDLTISGHTHGGQIAPFGKAMIVHSEFGYLAGGFEEEGSRLYVSRGVGVSVLPIRVGARPEVPIFTLRIGVDGSSGGVE